MYSVPAKEVLCQLTPGGDRLKMYSKTLKTSIRPYNLRHAFALQFLRNGGHTLALQRTLGHTDLTMTKRYVALTEAQDGEITNR